MSNVKFFLLLSILTLFTTCICYAVELSPGERKYIASAGTVRVCIDPDWYPFEKLDEKGEYVGIGADLFKLVAERTGLKYEIYRTSDWDVSLLASKEGKCDIVSFLNKTPQREEWLDFTEPHFTDVNVFITRNDHKFISDPSQLYNETIAFPKGTSMEERVRMNYPNLRVVVTDTEKEAFEMVEDREADMTMRSLIVAGYTIREAGYFNLKIAGQMPDYKNVFRMGVVKSKPELVEILNKGIASVTNQDRELIINKYVPIRVGKDYKGLIIKTAAAFIILMIAILIYHFYKVAGLKAKLNEKTSSESDTGLLVTSRISRILESEIKRAKRYARPLSVAIISFGDAYGDSPADTEHFAGMVKAAFSGLRSSDYAGRWGRSELLVIFTETDIKGAALAFERIYALASEYLENNGLNVTIHFGMSEFSGTDDMNTLISRADTVLFMSKDDKNY